MTNLGLFIIPRELAGHDSLINQYDNNCPSFVFLTTIVHGKLLPLICKIVNVLALPMISTHFNIINIKTNPIAKANFGMQVLVNTY